MSILSTAVQKQVEKAIIDQGVITSEKFIKLREEAITKE